MSNIIAPLDNKIVKKASSPSLVFDPIISCSDLNSTGTLDLSGSDIQGTNASQVIFPSMSYRANRSGNQVQMSIASCSGTVATPVNDINIVVPLTAVSWLITAGLQPIINTATPIVVSIGGTNEIAIISWVSAINAMTIRRLNGALFPAGSIALPFGCNINWLIN
jgi:hypothetical protein